MINKRPDSPFGQTEIDLVFAADLGGTNLRSATVDENGRVHFRLKQNTPQTDRPEKIVGALVTAVLECKAQSENLGGSISAVSVVVPGSVNVEQGLVVKAPNLPCLDGFQLTAALSSETNLPAIIENDANAAAVGEMWQGAGKGQRTIVCVTLGTGVGGGSFWTENYGGRERFGRGDYHMCVVLRRRLPVRESRMPGSLRFSHRDCPDGSRSPATAPELSAG